MEDYFKIGCNVLQRLLERPILNVDFNYCYIPVQVAALKCYLVIRDLQTRDIKGSFFNLFFFLVTIGWILPNIRQYSIGNAIVDFGVLFSLSYVRCLLFLHRRTVFLVYDLVAFIGCIVCNKIEIALDLYLIMVFLYNYLFVEAFRDYEITASILFFRILEFIFMWRFYYWEFYYFVIWLLLRIDIQIFSSRIFLYSLMAPSILRVCVHHWRRISEHREIDNFIRLPTLEFIEL